MTYADPTGEQKAEGTEKCNCCCCAKSVKFVDVGLKDWPPQSGLSGKYYGVDVELGTEWMPSDEYADCTLEFYEWSNFRQSGTYKGKPIPRRHWNDMYVKQHNSPTFAPWRDKAKVTDCEESGTAKTYTIHDTPSMSAPKPTFTWNLYYAVVLRSAKGCPCNEPLDVDAYAHMRLKVKNGQIVTTGKDSTGLTIGPLPKPRPGYPPGLPLNSKKEGK